MVTSLKNTSKRTDAFSYRYFPPETVKFKETSTTYKIVVGAEGLEPPTYAV